MKDNPEGQQENNDEVINMSSIWDFNKLYWLTTALCLTLYGGYLPFNYISSGFFTKTYFNSMDPIEASKLAGIYMSIPFFISAFMVPIFGILIDRFGQRAYLSLIAGIMGMLGFISFILMSNPLFGLIILGLTYSMFASVIWPAISLVVKKSSVGLAYGLTTSIQNIGLAVFPIIVASIYSQSNSYFNTLLFFISVMILSILLALVLICQNSKMNSIYIIINIIRYHE